MSRPAGVDRDDRPACFWAWSVERSDIREVAPESVEPGDQERLRLSSAEPVQRGLQTWPGGGGYSAVLDDGTT